MIIILIISLLLECAISSIIILNSIFNPLFLIISLVILYPYLKKESTKYLIVCSVCGFIYDTIFYNSIFLNTISKNNCSIEYCYFNNKTNVPKTLDINIENKIYNK